MTDEAKNPEAEKPQMSKAEAIAKITELKNQLKRQEATSGPSGAMPAAPTAMILDATGVSAKQPDRRFRWVSVNKAQRRQIEGYVRASEAELPPGFGTAQRGNLILMSLPREVYEARVAQIKQVNKERLSSHIREAEESAESLAKYLRDKHGVSVRAEDFLIKG